MKQSGIIYSVLCSVLIGNLFAFDVKEGEYELSSGDESICEDGPIKIKGKDLSLGTRYLFLDFKSNSLSYKSDDSSCEYKITNIQSKQSYKQILNQVCKIKNENLKREIEFHYNSTHELIMKITTNKKLVECKLKWVK